MPPVSPPSASGRQPTGMRPKPVQITPGNSSLIGTNGTSAACTAKALMGVASAESFRGTTAEYGARRDFAGHHRIAVG